MNLNKYVGMRFYEVYGERHRDGGAVIRCFGCGGALVCRAPEEIVERVSQLMCRDCLPAPLGIKAEVTSK